VVQLKSRGLAISSGLWETWGMVKCAFPAVGDIVVSQDHTGTFKVLSASAENMAELQPFHVGKQEVFGKVMTHIPTSRLRPFQEDASQSAARIVREATES
jgi:hypothetical protein